jgi:hypothetical protein
VFEKDLFAYPVFNAIACMQAYCFVEESLAADGTLLVPTVTFFCDFVLLCFFKCKSHNPGTFPAKAAAQARWGK